MKQVYYAHSMQIYGTKREKAELVFLRGRYKKVKDPNSEMIYDGNGMELYLAEVDKSSSVVCSEYKRHIGRGVFEEVSRALSKGKPVMCLRKIAGVFQLKEVKAVEVVDETDWKVKFGRVVLGKGN